MYNTEGRCWGMFRTQYWNMFGKNEENHDKPRIFAVPIETRNSISQATKSKIMSPESSCSVRYTWVRNLVSCTKRRMEG